MKTAHKLTPYQRIALSQSPDSIPGYVWNTGMFRIYGRVSRDNAAMAEGQTFEEFLEMEQRAPNEEGTGRYKFRQIRKIQILLLPKSQSRKNCKSQNLHMLTNFVHKYLRIPTELISSPRLAITKHKTVVEKDEQVQFAVRKSAKGLEANDILSVLLEYREEDTVIVGLADCQLYQEEDGDQVDGRACGDGAAVISFPSQQKRQNPSELLYVALTLLHQLLHTLGFDHCKAWTCLMNAMSNLQGWLCPACSRKLYHQLSLSTPSSVKQWLREVTKLYADLSAKSQREKGDMIYACL